MEKLFSPWRSQYISSFSAQKQDETEDTGCVFCDNKDSCPKKIDNLVVYQGLTCFVTMNLYPYNAGHLMVIPKRHLNDFSLLTEEEQLEIMKLAGISMRALKTVVHPQGFNMGANLGKAAGAGIDQHLHFHIVPRWNGDTNFMPVLGEVRVISQDLLGLKKKIEEAFVELTEIK